MVFFLVYPYLPYPNLGRWMFFFAGSAKLRSISARPTAGGPVVQSWKDVMCFVQDFARRKFGTQNPVVA